MNLVALFCNSPIVNGGSAYKLSTKGPGRKAVVRLFSINFLSTSFTCGTIQLNWSMKSLKVSPASCLTFSNARYVNS